MGGFCDGAVTTLPGRNCSSALGAHEDWQAGSEVGQRHAETTAYRRIGGEAPVLAVEALAAREVPFGALHGLLPAVERQAAIHVEQDRRPAIQNPSDRYAGAQQQGDLIEL